MDFESLALPNVDTSNWPVWLAKSWPFIEKWGLVLLACLLIWFVSGLVKRIVTAFGKRVSAKDKSFEGSSWDIARS